jgi:uncharacterized lipoprotein YmbA
MNVRHTPRILRLGIYAVLLLLLCACGNIGQSPATRFYALTVPEETDVQSMNLEIDGPRVAIGVVNIPAYLDRQPVLFRASPGDSKLVMNEYDQWGEPLDEGLTRVLSQVITTRLRDMNGAAFTKRAPLTFDWIIGVAVSRFDGILNDTITLDAVWTLVSDNSDYVREGRFTSTQPAGDSVSSVVNAYSKLAAELGDELSRTVRQGVSDEKTMPKGRKSKGSNSFLR